MNQTPCGHDVAHTCNRCNFAKATSLAASENRALCYEELSFILTAAIARTDYADALSVLDIFRRDFTPNELEGMLATRIERGSYALASHAARMAGRKLAQFELDQVAIIGLRVHRDAHQAVEMAVQGLLSTAAIRILIDIATQKSLRQTREFLNGKLAELVGLTETSETAPAPAEA